MKRFDLQGPMHKGLRGAMADALLAVGRMDPADDCEVRDALARLEDMLAVCEKHAERENEIVNRSAEMRSAGACAGLAGEHVEHLGAIDELRSLARRRDASLYRRLCMFVADMMRHMEREEAEGEATLRALFDEAGLAALERRLLAALARPEAVPTLRWMLPALAHGERVALLRGLRGASADAYEGALALARTHLGPREAQKLERSLDQREDATLES